MLNILKIIIIFFISNIYAKELNKILISRELDIVIESLIKTYNLSSFQLSIAESDNLISKYKGYTTKDNISPINANQLFQIGSISKTFIAYEIINLLKTNKINLNDKIIKYLPQYKSFKDVSIKQLLNQTSGIYNYIDLFSWWKLYIFPSSFWTSERLIKSVENKFYFNAGEGWHYSNTNYVILGLLIEKITNNSLENILKNYNKIFNLKSTFYISGKIPSTIKLRLSHGYYNNKFDTTNISPSWLQGGGAIISNANDISKWYLFYSNMIFKNYSNEFVQINNGKKINNLNNINYGFAIFSMPTPYGLLWFTPGLTPGYTALAGYLPCKNIAFVYLIPSNFSTLNIHIKILADILPTITNNIKNYNYKICQTIKSKQIDFPNF